MIHKRYISWNEFREMDEIWAGCEEVEGVTSSPNLSPNNFILQINRKGLVLVRGVTTPKTLRNHFEEIYKIIGRNG